MGNGDGPIVPVSPQADKKDLLSIAGEVRNLAQVAKIRALSGRYDWGQLHHHVAR
jgi:hypothetical protein